MLWWWLWSFTIMSGWQVSSWSSLFHSILQRHVVFLPFFFFFLLIAFFVCEYCMVLFCCLLYVRVDLNRSREFFFLLLVLYTTSQLASTLSALRGCVLTKGDPSQTLTSSQSWVGYDGCGLSLSHSPLLFSRLPHSLFSFTLCLCSQFLGSWHWLGTHVNTTAAAQYPPTRCDIESIESMDLRFSTRSLSCCTTHSLSCWGRHSRTGRVTSLNLKWKYTSRSDSWRKSRVI